MQQVSEQLAQLDLSTTSVIVLADEQWQAGVLGLVAGQIAQEYGRPTILLSIEGPLARGSARSVNNIDLYQLVKEQEHLLDRFGGHPYAAGLSLPVNNLSLFRDAINQQLRRSSGEALTPTLQIDLVVTVADLGKELFQALKLLEPCGMGNPVPKLLIQNCWFEKVWNKKIHDRNGGQVQYIKTEFIMRDESTTTGFAGVWWGHYKEEIPQGRCDAVVELDFNTYTDEAKGKRPHYEVRLIAVRSHEESISIQSNFAASNWILDYRGLLKAVVDLRGPLVVRQCPSSWTDLQAWFRRAYQENRQLAIAFASPLSNASSQNLASTRWNCQVSCSYRTNRDSPAVVGEVGNWRSYLAARNQDAHVFRV